MVEPAILERLDAAKVRYCLFGAAALAARGYARFTAVRDLLTLDRAVLAPSFWAGLTLAPALREGDPSDPLVGVVRWPAPWHTDLIVGKGYAAGLAVSTAENLRQIGVPVPTALALALCKLEAGGVKDQQDIVALVEAQRALGHTDWFDEIAIHVRSCTADAQATWARVAPLIGLEKAK